MKMVGNANNAANSASTVRYAGGKVFGRRRAFGTEFRGFESPSWGKVFRSFIIIAALSFKTYCELFLVNLREKMLEKYF
jgi:hypothetical protein